MPTLHAILTASPTEPWCGLPTVAVGATCRRLVVYERRRPEETTLSQLCREFARLRCDGCEGTCLVAFKLQGSRFLSVVPGRKMAATAAHLMEDVLRSALLCGSVDNVANVAAAARSTCAAKSTGAVFCWGENKLGRLGSGAAGPTPNPSPTVVTGLDATAVWAGADHACAVKRGGPVACRGAGVRGVTNAVKVGTGGNHSSGTTVNTILCRGENDRGQLGTGAFGAPLHSPESVVGYP